MDARLRRIASDYEQIKKDFAGHKNIIVTPIGEEPYEKYHVTYFVNGIYLQPDGRIETLGRHEIEIILHAEYPRYKPICKILTPIWHPNFRDGQICIGDIWGAGESLTDIIINIGNMIQYKSWNSFSPLSADAAAWAIENKHLFPVGNIDLYIADYESAKDTVEIDLISEDNSVAEDNKEETIQEENVQEESAHQEAEAETTTGQVSLTKENENYFEITSEELEGVEYIPIADKMQGATINSVKKVKAKVNIKTILVKGIVWALLGAIIGFGVGELVSKVASDSRIASVLGYNGLSGYFKYMEKANDLDEQIYRKFVKYCKANGIDKDDDDAYMEWLTEEKEDGVLMVEEYIDAYEKSQDYLYESYTQDFFYDEKEFTSVVKRITRTSMAIWTSVIALFIGLFLGIGEGIYYGSKEKAVKFAAIGAGISTVIGGISGYIAQWMYASLLDSDSSLFVLSLVRGIGWAILGLGIGLAVGLIKPGAKRIISCMMGGLIGAFIGGFLFNYIGKWVAYLILARGIGLVIMGILIGVGVGLLEQFAKSAWLKVIRGEFEGKEYLVFPGTTSIGNTGKNTIVLFKDKLVGPHHCDIILHGSKYIIRDCGTPMGTVVNGMKISQHVLRQGDAIAIGNSVLIFNTTK